MKLKTTILAIAAAGLCATAIAQTAPATTGAPPNDTVKLVIANGVSLDIQGMPIDMKYAADGTFSGAGGMFSGKYRTDGDKICISSDMLQGQELCSTYPAGKKAGDSFEIEGMRGSQKVTINAAPAAAPAAGQ